MATKLYVGRLPYEMTSEELKAIFAEVGEVTEATVISDKMSGRSRGFGFVEMATEEAADKAVAELNGKAIGKMTLVVDKARPMAPRE